MNNRKTALTKWPFQFAAFTANFFFSLSPFRSRPIQSIEIISAIHSLDTRISCSCDTESERSFLLVRCVAGSESTKKKKGKKKAYGISRYANARTRGSILTLDDISRELSSPPPRTMSEPELNVPPTHEMALVSFFFFFDRFPFRIWSLLSHWRRCARVRFANSRVRRKRD